MEQEKVRLRECKEKKYPWRDLILFYEYFHGDNGAGIGASHQYRARCGTHPAVQVKKRSQGGKV